LNSGVLPSPPYPSAASPPKIDLTQLPAGAEHFLGRHPELAALDTAWAEGSATSVVELIAPGGTGKTALIKRWLERLRTDDWGGAAQVFGWSFYSQGGGDDRQASEDNFLAAAIDRLGIPIDPAAHPADTGRALSEAVAGQRALLILDGLEPLQYPPGPLAGELRAPGLKTLLTQVAATGQPGLCLVTSRARLRDLAEWVRTETHPDGSVLRIDLENLCDRDGARLLHARGATRAGAAVIEPDDPELRQASREVQGHALTLSLLGRYLGRVRKGDIRRRGEIDLVRAGRDAGKQAARVVAAYETWLARAGADGARELAALRLLGLFDRPAGAELLDALREAPPIPGLTEPLQDLDADTWATTLANLADGGLIQRHEAPEPATDRAGGGLDAHPLVREHLAERLRSDHPEAWREGHRRLYERLKASVPRRPDGLDGLQPIYQAVAHGCLAGLWEEALAEVYIDRVLRGTRNDGFSSWKQLGAFGANLSALAYLFAEPWRRPVPALSTPYQGWLLNEAAIQLRGLGRLADALEPMRVAAEIAVERQAWQNAAQGYGNLSELLLALGRIDEAVADARRSVDYADPRDYAFLSMGARSTLADALHQQGEVAAAQAAFAEAEALQAERQPQYPLLYSLGGFGYCDLLLAAPERAAWSDPGDGPRLGGGDGNRDAPSDGAGLVAACAAVARRAMQTLEWAEALQGVSILDFALIYLTLARFALCSDRLQGRPPGPKARNPTEQALDRLRAAGDQMYISTASAPARGSITPSPIPPPPTLICARPSASPSAAVWPCIWPTSP